jgi:NADH-quinone oxidoreductase subunit J
VTAENVIFGIFAAVMAIAAFRVVTTNNVVHAALWLAVVLGGGAALFLLLAQEFVAWVQVIVYIGAVIVLVLFGVMLTRAPMQAEAPLNNDLRFVGALTALVLAGTLGWTMIDRFHAEKIRINAPVRTAEVGRVVFRGYLIPFEVVGILLLGALIGAVVLARRD